MHQPLFKSFDQTPWSKLVGSIFLVAIAPVTVLVSQLQAPAPPVAPEPEPEPEPSQPLIEELPNANYRYINAEVAVTERTEEGVPIVSPETLEETEGYSFLFQKVDGQVVGMLYKLASKAKICVAGQVSGNTIAGQAIARFESPFTPVQVLSEDTDFAPWDSAETLQIRQGTRTGIRVVYDGALLDLNGFYRINAGGKPPPEDCV